MIIGVLHTTDLSLCHITSDNCLITNIIKYILLNFYHFTFYYIFQVCDVQSGTQMTCPTPNITLPANFNTISSNQRRKRQTIDVVEYKINSDALQFYVGFRLDGVTLYRNLSISNPQYSILNVFFNPEFEDFEGGVRLHRPYWPFSDTIVTINVSLNFT